MNYLEIHSFCDFKQITESFLIIYNKTLKHEKISKNMWAISIAEQMLKDLFLGSVEFSS